MPIYDYYCESCEETFEITQKFSDDPITTCKFCSGPVRKVISAPGIVFKGSGWYVTDYPSNDRKKAMEADNGNGKGNTKPASCATSGCSAPCEKK